MGSTFAPSPGQSPGHRAVIVGVAGPSMSRDLHGPGDLTLAIPHTYQPRQERFSIHWFQVRVLDDPILKTATGSVVSTGSRGHGWRRTPPPRGWCRRPWRSGCHPRCSVSLGRRATPSRPGLRAAVTRASTERVSDAASADGHVDGGHAPEQPRPRMTRGARRRRLVVVGVPQRQLRRARRGRRPGRLRVAHWPLRPQPHGNEACENAALALPRTCSRRPRPPCTVKFCCRCCPTTAELRPAAHVSAHHFRRARSTRSGADTYGHSGKWFGMIRPVPSSFPSERRRGLQAGPTAEVVKLSSPSWSLPGGDALYRLAVAALRRAWMTPDGLRAA